MTNRELEILELLSYGKTNKQIAAELGISDFTVRDHVSSLLRKSGARNRTELVARRIQEYGEPLPLHR